MIENGHSWSSIKEYNLSEIGVFFKVIVLRQKEKKFENLSQLWMGNNLSQDGIREILNGGKKVKEIEPSDDEVAKDWKRLQSFMAKQR